MMKTTTMTTERQTPTTNETAAIVEGLVVFLSFRASCLVAEPPTLICSQLASLQTRIIAGCQDRRSNIGNLDFPIVSRSKPLIYNCSRFPLPASSVTRKDNDGVDVGVVGVMGHGSWKLICVTWISSLKFGSRCCGAGRRGAVPPFSGAFGRLQAGMYLVLS